MSFKINNKIEIKSAGRVVPWVPPPAPPILRGFYISPAWQGKTTWSLDQDGPLNFGTSGSWTITPTSNFTSSVKMWGDGGASYAASNGGTARNGGGGGFSSGSIQFNQWEKYQLVVSYNRFQNGASAGVGGGLSGIFSSSIDYTSSIMIAGGGGVGGNYSSYGGAGGAGGGTNGQAGTGGSQAGTGGTQTGGGTPSIYNNAQPGTKLRGGVIWGYPNGGSGYWGGAAMNAAGSGGGSGYIHPTKVISGSTLTGNYQVPANSADTYRSGSGEGAIANNSIMKTGSYGRVVIF